MRFQPSSQFYASTEDPGTTTSEGTGLSEEYLRAARVFFFGEDVRERREILTQKLAKQQQLAAQNFPPGRAVWTELAKKTEAQLRAVERQAVESEYAAATLGMTRTAVAVASVVSAVALAAFAMNQINQARVQREELSRLRGRN